MNSSRNAYLCSRLAGLIALAGFLSAVGIFGYQILFWLKYGIWHPVPLSVVWQAAGLPLPTVSWSGVQKIFNWMFDLTASLGGIGVALIAVQTYSSFRNLATELEWSRKAMTQMPVNEFAE
ncbi:MAG TPA: hypothetical protein VL899_14590 [Alphaproteobacteria bacterium]|nr:hypothetical protein [Alphaproteobacteria bacterium]